MQMGYNNDVPYKALTLHIQTEDHGLPSAKVTSHVFFSGAILESRTRSYAEEIARLADDTEREEYIRKFMKAMHRSFYKRIQDGVFDARLPLKGVAPVAVEPIGALVDDALDTPVELLETEGFDVAGELHELGETYALHSRGIPLPPEALLMSGDHPAIGSSDQAAWRGLDAQTFQAADQIGEDIARVVSRRGA